VAWWDADKRELVRPLLHTHLETEEMKVNGDGSMLFVASTGPLALVATAPQGDWQSTACSIANRSLTSEEWEEYMRGLPYDPACK
jgi:hypothetical protein